MNKNKVGLVWLYNDLRIHDNATLNSAIKHCEKLIILYATYEPQEKQRGQTYHFNALGEHRKRFLHESLSDLACSIQSLGNQLIYIESATTFDIVRLLSAHKVTDVYRSKCADYDHNARVQTVAERLPEINIHSSNTQTLFDNLPMIDLPTVFTQFRNKIEKNRHLLREKAPVVHVETPTRLPPMPEGIDSSMIYNGKQPIPQAESFIGGETQALLHVQKYFSSNAPQFYKETRNALDDWDSSTKFSLWLANGSLSVRTLLVSLREYEKSIMCNDSTYWIWFELLWREYFYWYAKTHGKKLFTLKGITPCKRRSCFYGERYERWKNGNTPYSIVNACMNQLRETGYMSNRGRQLAASCFVHELGMDWRYGATYFQQQLIDYDVASNWGNWQYIAGVGADPRGGRQFNLNKQTAQYDPNGEFIKKWRGDVGEIRLDSVDAADWPIG